MMRPSLYIFSQNNEMLNSLCRFVKYICIGLENIRHEFDPKENAQLFSTIDDITVVLDKKSPLELLKTVILLDITGKEIENSWNVVSTNSSITGIAGRLVLMYPEVYWIFIGLPDFMPDIVVYWCNEHFVCPSSNIKRLNTLLKYHSNGYSPLFDASGLRSWLKHIATNKINKKDKSYSLPLASSAIDEESAYAFINGYIAYRMGYRCYPVTTLSMMENLFKSSNSIKTEINLVFEDIFLNFPDKSIDKSLSNLKVRDSDFTRLKDVNKRVFVTVGHKHIKWYDSNRAYLEFLKGQGKEVKKVYKPSGGIYNLLKKSSLQDEYREHRRNKLAVSKEDTSEGDGHSAPGRLLEIAEILINRAEKLYHEAKTVEECIYGAILASEAIELLDYKTPTTCLEAIALRHKLEVKAECMFYGVEYNIDVKGRLRDLKKEIKAISHWFHKSIKEKSSLNAQMMIVTEIMKIFREHGQFDEEQGCMKYFRTLNRHWYFKRHPYLLFFKPFKYYFDTLIGNFRCFLVVILLLPLIFGFISYAIKADFNENGKRKVITTVQSNSDSANQSSWDISDYIANAYFTFYGLQPVEFPKNTYAKVFAVTLVLTGFLHLGIFISYLFTILSRRN